MSPSSSHVATLRPTVAELLQDVDVTGSVEILSRDEAELDDGFAPSMRLESLWESLPGPIPRRADLDPIALGAALLPSLVILNVLDGGADYSWRLFGSAHAAQYGGDLTGVKLSQIEDSNPSGKALRSLLDDVVANGCPAHFRLNYANAGGLCRSASGVFLPLTEDGGSVDFLLGCVTWS